MECYSVECGSDNLIFIYFTRVLSSLCYIVMGNVLNCVRRRTANCVHPSPVTFIEEEQAESERLPKYTKPLLSYLARELRKHKEYTSYRQSLVSPTCYR